MIFSAPYPVFFVTSYHSRKCSHVQLFFAACPSFHILPAIPPAQPECESWHTFRMGKKLSHFLPLSILPGDLPQVLFAPAEPPGATHAGRILTGPALAKDQQEIVKVRATKSHGLKILKPNEL